MKSPMSLKMRAITLLSQREHSPVELRRKLMRIQAETARALSAASAQTGCGDADSSDDGVSGEAGSAQTEIDALLAWLQTQGYLSEARFVESRVNARASRYGSLRIKQELAQHGLSLTAENQAELRACEAERAQAVWQRKFGDTGGASSDPAQRAKQLRFLTARGFAPDVIRRVLRAAGSEQADD